MSSLLKHSDDPFTVIRKVEWSASSADAQSALPVTSLGAELSEQAKLRSQLAALQEAAAADRAVRAKELEAAREAGRKEGAAAAKVDEDKRVQALKDAAKSALENLSQLFEGAEQLASMVSETALEQLVGRQERYGELIQAAIHRQFAMLRDHGVVALHVSRLDFATPELLQALQRQLGEFGQIRIETDTQVKAGACRIELKVGSLDLSLPRYWEELRTALRLGLEGADAIK